MGASRVRAFAIGSTTLALACANILGIDDGTPRDDDASIFDAFVPTDVSTKDADAGIADVVLEAPPFSALHCGTMECNFALGEKCCRTGSATYSCVVDASACSGTFIPCDRPEQCATDAGAMACCTNDILSDAGTYIASSVDCVLETKCTPIPTHYILCGDDSGADCPDGESCAMSSTTLPTFLICK